VAIPSPNLERFHWDVGRLCTGRACPLWKIAVIPRQLPGYRSKLVRGDRLTRFDVAEAITGRLVLHSWNEATCRAILRQRDRSLCAVYLLTRLIGIVVSCVVAWASFGKVVSSWLRLSVAETPARKGTR
jgi:hypothetical protein